MRPFAALAVAALSLSSVVVSTPLDSQVILPDDGLVDDKRWSYTVCGMMFLHSFSSVSSSAQETPATSFRFSQLR